MPVIVEADSASIAPLLSLMPPGSHSVASIDRMHAWLDQHADEYVVVLGPGVPLEVAIECGEDLRIRRPTVSVVLVREQFGTDVLTRSMHAGIRDVVVAGDDEKALTRAVERAHQLYEALRGPGGVRQLGRIVTVFSPKGGVGKTTSSVNLALALTDRGARKVCLVDLDLAFGDVAITLGLVPSRNIEEAIGAEETLDESLVNTLLIKYGGVLDVLAAPNLPDARDRITPALVSRMLRNLRTQFDYVVVDTAPNFDDQTLQALDETDECVIIATLDVPTLKNVKVALETLDLLNIALGHRHLVLNRADEAVGLDHDNVQSILHMQIATPIPSSTEIAAATNAGRPIVLGNPGHPASRAFRQLASELASACGDDLSGETPTTDHERRGLRLRKKK